MNSRCFGGEVKVTESVRSESLIMLDSNAPCVLAPLKIIELQVRSELFKKALKFFLLRSHESLDLIFKSLGSEGKSS